MTDVHSSEVPPDTAASAARDAPFRLLDLPVEILLAVAARWTAHPYGLPSGALYRAILPALASPDAVARRAVACYGWPQNALFAEVGRAARTGAGLEVTVALLDMGASAQERGYLGEKWSLKPLLVWATEQGADPSLLALLLDRGADPNASAMRGYPALVAACGRGDTAQAALLLARGAHPFHPDGEAFQSAIGAGHAAVVALLLGTSAYDDTLGEALAIAVRAGDTDCVRVIFDRVRGAGGAPASRTALADLTQGLIMACRVWNPELVRLFIDAGADPNASGTQNVLLGRTPLAAAIAGWHPEAVAFLLAAGADPRARDAQGRPPLWHALQGDEDTPREAMPPLESRARIVRALLDAGVDPTPPLLDDADSLPLVLACRVGEPALVTYLLVRGADPNARCGPPGRRCTARQEVLGERLDSPDDMSAAAAAEVLRWPDPERARRVSEMHERRRSGRGGRKKKR